MNKNIIGIDLDNTIVAYDTLLFETALERGYISNDITKSKMAVRDAVRNIPNGEVKWQELQAAIYGPLMYKAQLFDGIIDFLINCRKKDQTVYIVSHKTEFANYDTTKTNLRDAALSFLESKNFFKKDLTSVTKQNVFFKSTREDKISKIKELDCGVFIDDLIETFSEKTFPQNVKKILFDPHELYPSMHGIVKYSSWFEITNHIFNPSSPN